MPLVKLIRAAAVAIAMVMGCILPATAQINAEQVMRIGQNSLYFEDYMLSIQYFNQVIGAKPYLAQPFFFRAIAKLNLDDYAGAEADASHAIELNPFITDAYEVRGVARQNLGDNRGAIADYRHALKLLPQNRQLMFNMAMAQQSAGELDGADSTFAALLKAYPNFDNGYVGRARLNLERGDTTAAEKDIARSIEINPNIANSYVMRAQIAIQRHQDYADALEDMDRAIKLMPRQAGLYINRAFLRYNLDDYFGSMADYDYALQLEPVNTVALFNRGLLLAEVNAYDRALADFSKVVDLKPNDYRARYNRASIYAARGEYTKALSDLNKVIADVPDFPGLVMMRSDIYRKMGNRQAAMRDYDKALAMTRRMKSEAESAKADSTAASTDVDPTAESDSPEDVSRMFATLLTIENDTEIEQEFNNKDIRGKVQDRNFNIEIEPMMELSYHASPTELRENTYYIKELDDLNATRVLRQGIVVTNNPPALTHSEDIDAHFASIEYYNAYLATHTPRAADYLGRALDFFTVHNYAAALKDLDRAIDMAPDYALSYFLRAQTRHHVLLSGTDNHDEKDSEAATDPTVMMQMRRAAYEDILSDIAKVIELSPRMALAHYNRGNIYVELQDMTSALSAYNEALRLKPDLGEAYFNRGFVYLRLGNRDAAVADLSKAGELGVIPAYSLLKRISR